MSRLKATHFTLYTSETEDFLPAAVGAVLALWLCVPKFSHGNEAARIILPSSVPSPLSLPAILSDSAGQIYQRLFLGDAAPSSCGVADCEWMEYLAGVGV